MNECFVSLAVALADLSARGLSVTVVVGVVLTLGSIVLVVCLLIPSLRKRLAQWMARQEGTIWTDTLAFVDAETAMYRQLHHKAALRGMNGNGKREPVLPSGEVVRVKTLAPEPQLHELVE